MAQLLVTVAVNAAISYGAGLLYQAIVGTPTTKNEGTRLSEVQISSSTEGSTQKRLWGTARLGGQIVWSTRFLETKNKKTSRQGGKGGGGGQKVETTTYTYSVSFAVAVCEGDSTVTFGRVWADGKILDLSKHTVRFYSGTETQTADPLIEEKEGTGRAPAFRGTAYLVFDNMDLTNFGNRIPQISVEVSRAATNLDYEAWTMIPSAGEFVYGTREYIIENKGNSEILNVHNSANLPDIIHSLDQLEVLAPNTQSILLVVSWFGDDLRIGDCTLRPKREVSTSKDIFPQNWRVSNLTQSNADIVTQISGNPAYGGTPADIVVREAVQHIQSRGWRVVFYPFILMDIGPGNSLPDIGGGTGQPAFPWRGRITLGNPADDQQSAAATQVASFVGTVAPGHYGTWDGSTLPYSGPTEWSYRRMILHYAALLSDILDPGDAFIIGSEMVGATSIRSSSSNYPFVNSLISIAADVSSMLGSGRLISYAADWTEYNSHRPSDGSNDVRYNLDPLWASADIDFVGIDAYFPISDWREGSTHEDYDVTNGITNIYISDYLKANIEGGELYDWYYASDSDRTNQVRTPIVDTAEGKHWVFRQKDFRNWWINEHFNRPGGVESGSPTAWTPMSKPIWFTEFGCPAVDKGPNQPNVFVDPKSSESFVPYFSNGKRDDAIQRVHNNAVLEYWRDNGGSMIEPANMHVWTWDARPYPWFPYLDDVWSDGGNWELGHWMTGRLGVILLSSLVKTICQLGGVPSNKINVTRLEASDVTVRGFIVEDIRSPRDMLADLMTAYSFDGFESEGKLTFDFRATAPSATWAIEDLVSTNDNPGGYSITRAQETELQASLKLTYVDEVNDFNVGGADARTRVTDAENVTTVAFPLVLTQEYARALGDVIIQEGRVKRESFEIVLPPSALKFDAGDVISITIKGRSFLFRISEIDVGMTRTAQGTAHDYSIYTLPAYNGRAYTPPSLTTYGRATVAFMDIPLVSGEEPLHHAPRLAAYMDPWPGAVNVFEDDDAGGFELDTQVVNSSIMGELAFDFYGAPAGSFDMGNSLYFDLNDPDDTLTSSTDLAVLNGANVVAVQNDAGGWEIVQFVNAELIDVGRYRLHRLLRGQLGSEEQIGSPSSAGNRVVVLDQDTLSILDLKMSELGQDKIYRWGSASLPVGNSRYRQASLTFQGIGLKPYAPTHLKAVKDWGTNHIALSWIRRTRFNGDNWDTASVPLNEESEAYEVDIMDGGTVVRTIEVTSPNVTYTSSQQTADFGAPISTIKFRVYQMSATFGRGSRAEATINA